MDKLPELFQSNRLWRLAKLAEDPHFFERLAAQHAPRYLWIGCADARVPANEILGLPPGDVFVHRNIANLVVHSDFNCQSVIQFAVEWLKVEHIMVVGHYGCSGVHAALRGTRIGLADNWIYHVRDVHDRYAERLRTMTQVSDRHDRLVELNVLEQVVNVCQSNAIEDAWRRGQPVTVHAWVYGVGDGLLRDLGLTVSGRDGFLGLYQDAVEGAFAGKAAAAAAPASA